MKSIQVFVVTSVLGAFGMLTLFLSSSVIFDVFNIRAQQGNYVLFIVWANFFSGILFLIAAFASFKRKIWSHVPVIVSLGILGIAFAGLMIYISASGAYETKTVGAMIFRMTVNAVLVWVLYPLKKKHQASTLVKAGMLSLLPLTMLVAGCGQRHVDEHNHHVVDAETSHHHEEDGESVGLNNGEKWEADEHTLSVVKDMRAELSDFAKVGEENSHVLADSLTHQLSALVAGCTMKGPAHDELHKWLVPLTESVRYLAAAQEPSGARGEVIEIRKSLNAFDDFFEGKAK